MAPSQRLGRRSCWPRPRTGTTGNSVRRHRAHWRQHRLALRVIGLRAAGQQQGVAEHHHAVLRPDVEMADPQLLVDPGDEARGFRPAAIGNLQVEGAGEMQGLALRQPGEGDIVIRPRSGDADRDFVRRPRGRSSSPSDWRAVRSRRPGAPPAHPFQFQSAASIGPGAQRATVGKGTRRILVPIPGPRLRPLPPNSGEQ